MPILLLSSATMTLASPTVSWIVKPEKIALAYVHEWDIGSSFRCGIAMLPRRQELEAHTVPAV
jgi:hypothetical protein